MSLDSVCQELAKSPLTNAQKAVVILLWHRRNDPDAQLTVADLAEHIRAHDLGNPKPAVLRDTIRKLRVTLPGKDGALRLRADCIDKIDGWLSISAERPGPMVPAPEKPGASRPATGEAPALVSRATPKLFIGSSVEGLPVGRAIHAELEHDCEPTVWDKGIFGANHAPLHDLLDHAARTDFAVVVLTPDDVVKSRGESRVGARDNCIFELGLFMGRLGLDRCFFVHQRGVNLGLPSDLAGLVTLTYPSRTDGNLQAALQTACDKIRAKIKKHGTREKPP